ncbi:MAG: membrane protein insertase YidC [Treponema sp.]|jgi:YidC/Oxa1 family membrane protein insertase|nr:membrane protein insertase YidC [Treponema sp.]
MEKNTVIAVALSSLVLVGFMFFQTVFFPSAAPPPETAAASVQSSGLDNIAAEETSLGTELSELIVDEGEAPGESTYIITTGKVRVIFTNRGGDVIHYELLDHREGDAGIEMADGIAPDNRAFALSLGGMRNGVSQYAVLNDLFSVARPDNTTIVFSKQFSVKNSAGTSQSFTLTKRYTFAPDDYMFKLDVGITGNAAFSLGGSAYTLRTSPQIGPRLNPQDKYDRRTFMAYNGQKKKTEVLKAGNTKERIDPYTWTGVGGKYFTLLVAPVPEVATQGVTYSAVTDINGLAGTQLFLPRAATSGGTVTDTYYVYIGPLTESTLKIYNNGPENPWALTGLHLNESLTSSGILSPLEAALKWCMEILNKVIHNWGVSIIILTLLIKALLFPLTQKSSMASLKMQEIQPKVQEIQAKYKSDPNKLQSEQMKFYKEAGVSPMSGCLPLLIQFPIIIAMYNLFNNYFEFRGALFIPGWIPDLSVGDRVFTFGFNIPFLGDTLRLLPIIYVASQLLSGKLTQTGGASNTQMKVMMYGMPLFFFFIFYNAPSGLLIYWTTSNILQLFQQLAINKVMKKKKEELAAKQASQVPVFVPRKKKK